MAIGLTNGQPLYRSSTATGFVVNSLFVNEDATTLPTSLTAPASWCPTTGQLVFAGAGRLVPDGGDDVAASHAGPGRRPVRVGGQFRRRQVPDGPRIGWTSGPTGCRSPRWQRSA